MKSSLAILDREKEENIIWKFSETANEYYRTVQTENSEIPVEQLLSVRTDHKPTVLLFRII